METRNLPENRKNGLVIRGYMSSRRSTGGKSKKMKQKKKEITGKHPKEEET